MTHAPFLSAVVQLQSLLEHVKTDFLFSFPKYQTATKWADASAQMQQCQPRFEGQFWASIWSQTIRFFLLVCPPICLGRASSKG